MKKILGVIRTVFWLLAISVACNTMVKAAEQTKTTENLVYVAGNTYVISVPRAENNVKWEVDKNKIVKISKEYGKNNRNIKVKAKKRGKCVITANCGEEVYKYIIHVEPKETYKSYNGKKVKFSIVKVKRSKKYVIVRIKIANGKNTVLTIDPDYVLQKKSDGKWVTVKQKYATAGTGIGISGKISMTYSVILSNLYDINELTKGKYRFGIELNNKMKYAHFKLK
ncbi:MAG: immunoglobulin-like domain-containing protein [Eubacterium sp.]